MKLNRTERWMVNNPVRAFMQRQIVRWMKSRRSLGPAARILEIGCGRGVGAALLERYFKPRSIVAVDMDNRMIRIAKRRHDGRSGSTAVFCLAEAVHLPFEDERFGAVFAFGLLHHVPDWRAALNQIARVLERGGCFFMEEYYPASYQNALTRHILKHPGQDRFKGLDLAEALENFGLDLIHRFEIKGFGILGVSLKA
jgi:ubiquinone/menaquinone biosynthesis C-methylase UbiE